VEVEFSRGKLEGTPEKVRRCLRENGGHADPDIPDANHEVLGTFLLVRNTPNLA
jgi:hypothetical protein